MSEEPTRKTRQRAFLDDERLEFLARLATLYYEESLTQSEISQQLGYSRSAISRFLTEARDVGVVEIRIKHPLVCSDELENRLRAEYGLREVRVLIRGGISYPKLLRRLGTLAAQIVQKLVVDNSIIGVAWGTGVYEVANALRPPHYPGIKVVQLIGSLGTADPQIDGPELAQSIARLYGGRYQTLPAPLVVDSASTRDALMRDSRIQDVLEQGRRADLAIVGIGTTDPTMSSMVRAGYITTKELKEISDSGAVGDICAQHLSRDGEIMNIPIMQRTIGIEADALRRIPIVLGVAAGDTKIAPARSAMRSKLINSIVVDDVTAIQILDNP